ncbi:bacterial regulatory s, tetR family protein [Mycobacterium xenopi 4042]|uniref:Bacterial regulatory s, tetR family protein n=1 Tax=Mycobacterium xenopi 4042 TaxID=1299334 RepID=X8CLS2_MYCXE|nr:bacterial regulatory s, tetR family protein [Mycobacterium xenopi 4042]
MNSRTPDPRPHRSGQGRGRERPSREERKEATRRAIVAAALKLLGDRSFGSLSLREVTREAGIVPAAFYRHFESMEALGLVLIDESFRTLRDMLRGARAGKLDPNRVIESSVEILVASVTDRREHWRFIGRERSSGMTVLRYAIRTEIRLITSELATDLARFPGLNAWSTEDLNVLATLFVNSMIVIAEAIEDAHSAEALEEIKRIAVKQLRMIAIGWPVGAATREVAALHRRGDDESMATKMSDLLGGVLASLRYEPTEKRLRVCLDDELVADTRRGLLVWEPRRVVPTYAVPVSDLSARLEHVETAAHPGDQPLLDPPSRPPRTAALARCSTSWSTTCGARRPRSGQTIPIWPTMSCLTSARSSGGKKTSRSWRTRTTRSNASTSWPAPATSGWSCRAGCWPHRRADAAVRDAAAGAVLSPTRRCGGRA